MKKILFVLFSFFLAATTLSAQSPIASEKNPEGPMTINWKAGKTLNGASKDEIKAWADEVVR